MHNSHKNFEIKELNLIKFGKFENYKIELDEGFNVIYGKNEAGKSTIQLFIKGMLYGLNTRKKSGERLKERDRVIPWNGTRAEGIMKISVKDRALEIRRRFGKTAAGDRVTVCDEISGEILSEYSDGNIGEAILGIPGSVFEKTLWIKQGAIPIDGKDDELIERLMNIESSGDEGVSVEAALAYLAREKRRLKAKDGRSANGIIDVLTERRDDCKRRRYELANQIIQTENIKERLVKLRLELTEAEKSISEAEDEYKKSIEAKRLIAAYDRFKKIEQCEVKLKNAEQDAEFIKATGIEESEVNQAFELQQRLSLMKGELNVQDNTKDYEAEWLKKHTRSSVMLGIGAALLGVSLVAVTVLLVMSMAAVAVAGIVILAISVLMLLYGLSLSKESKQIKQRLDFERESIQRREKEQRDEEYRIKAEYDKLMSKFEVRDAAELQRLYNYKLKQAAVIQSLKEAKLVYLENDSYEELKALAESGIIAYEYSAEDIEEKLNTERKRQIQLLSDIKELEGKMAYEVKISGLPSDIDTEIKGIEAEISECEHRLKVIDIVGEAIREASESFRASFAPELNKRASSIISRLTAGEYNGVRVAEDYRMRVEAGSELIDAEYFSFGTYEQLYLALRLASGELICRETPLFLDDILTVYDNERAFAALKFLKEVAEIRQVILFTCHQADEEKAKLIGAETININ